MSKVDPQQRRRRKSDPESSDAETVVEHDSSDEEQGIYPAAPDSTESHLNNHKCWPTNKEKCEAARDFFVLIVIGFVFVDMYARSHQTLWWTPRDDITIPHSVFT